MLALQSGRRPVVVDGEPLLVIGRVAGLLRAFHLPPDEMVHGLAHRRSTEPPIIGGGNRFSSICYSSCLRDFLGSPTAAGLTKCKPPPGKARSRRSCAAFSGTASVCSMPIERPPWRYT